MSRKDILLVSHAIRTRTDVITRNPGRGQLLDRATRELREPARKLWKLLKEHVLELLVVVDANVELFSKAPQAEVAENGWEQPCDGRRLQPTYEVDDAKVPAVENVRESFARRHVAPKMRGGVASQQRASGRCHLVKDGQLVW